MSDRSSLSLYYASGDDSMCIVVRVVTGNDGGGVRTSEAMFASEIRARGLKVLGVILGEGKSSSLYSSIYDDFLVLEDLPEFDGTIWKKFKNILPVFVHAVVQGRKLLGHLSQIEGKYILTTRQQPTLLFGAVVARLGGRSLYWHAPGPLMGLMQKGFFKTASAIAPVRVIANSRYTADQLASDLDDVVYPGFDDRRVRQESFGIYRQRLNISYELGVYGVIARINSDKASDLVVEAFIDSKPFEDGAHLILAGDADDYSFLEKIRKRVEREGRGRIHLIGFIEDVGRFISDVDIVVNGRRNAEPFGISIVEAMGAGKPVLAYKKGGPEETVKDGVTGWLVDEPTSEGYRRGFDRSWEHRALWREYGRRAEIASDDFLMWKQVDRYLDIIGAAKQV